MEISGLTIIMYKYYDFMHFIQLPRGFVSAVILEMESPKQFIFNVSLQNLLIYVLALGTQYTNIHTS